jgi:hypothetical protein
MQVFMRARGSKPSARRISILAHRPHHRKYPGTDTSSSQFTLPAAGQLATFLPDGAACMCLAASRCTRSLTPEGSSSDACASPSAQAASPYSPNHRTARDRHARPSGLNPRACPWRRARAMIGPDGAAFAQQQRGSSPPGALGDGCGGLALRCMTAIAQAWSNSLGRAGDRVVALEVSGCVPRTASP